MASTSSDPYSPFQHPLVTEDGPQSSEEGSGLHSPVFGALPVNGDSFRYHNDHTAIRHATGILTSQYDYAPPLDARESSIIDSKLQIPSPVTQSPSFRPEFSLNPRNQLSFDFPVQTSLHSHLLSTTTQSSPQVDLRYSPSFDKRLPGGSSYDQTYPRYNGDVPAIGMDGSHIHPSVSPVSPTHHPESSTSPIATNSRGSRKEASTVVIACRQCRGRKIRCDSTRPVCSNCVRRSNVCEYDLVPKRRGPDKRPGTRQRSCKKRAADPSSAPAPKRKRVANLDVTSPTKKGSMSDDKESPISPSSGVESPPSSRQTSRSSPPPSLHITTDPAYLGGKVTLDSSPMGRSYLYEPRSQMKSPEESKAMFSSPSQASFGSPSSPLTENWWENFVQSYSIKLIAEDMAFLFSETGHWLSFLNVNHFIKRLYDPQERPGIQPAFILSGLAMANLIRSSEVEGGANGRERAGWLRAEAQVHLDKAVRSNCIDASLAQAALIIALYEFSAHPHYDPDKIGPALILLDNLIHHLRLTSLDNNDTDACSFAPRSVPVVTTSGSDIMNDGCSCIPNNATQVPDTLTSWSYSVPWDPTWSPQAIYDEECRRLCWCSLGLVANYTAQCAALDRTPPKLYLTNPSSFKLLFPGEVADRLSLTYRSSDSLSPKDSVWGLYCRSMLLWVFCNNLQYDPTCPDEDKAEFAHEAWNESQSILDLLNLHRCNLDTILLYMSREYLYNARMAITQALRSLQGLSSRGQFFNRKQAEEWIFYQEQVIKRVQLSLRHVGGMQGHSMSRRPFDVSWYTCQLILCLSLWRNDQALVKALELAKSLLVPVETMNALWPCPPQQLQCNELKKQLITACNMAKVDPPMTSPLSSTPKPLPRHSL